MADFSPPLISGYVKLTRFAQIKIDKAYEDGFISLRTAEPSLGTPQGRTTRTEPGSAYYFPIFGIGTTYGASRKFTGNDTLMMRDKKIGFNNPFPTFSFDISGSIRGLEAELTTLSSSRLLPSPGTNTLNISYPQGVFIDSNVQATGNLQVKDITATNVFITNLLSANTLINDNTIIRTLTLTAAAINTDISVAGNISATNIFATSAIYTPTVVASSIISTNFNTNNMTVTNELSVVNDIYVNNIFGKIAIDPTSALIYNSNNQLTYSGSLDYTFFVHPTDKYATDDINTVRSPDGLYDTDVLHPDSVNGFKPCFQTLKGLFEYVQRSGIFGNNLYIRIFGDVVNGEQRKNNGAVPNDPSGTYSSLTTRIGNLTSAFFSFEWLGSRYPHLTAAGIKGGEFVWSNDGQDMFGEIVGLELQNINFNTLNIFGDQNIGTLRNRNTPKTPVEKAVFTGSGSGAEETPFYVKQDGTPLDFYYNRRLFNFPPTNIASRLYVWGGNPLSGWNARNATFAAPASSWLELNTRNTITYTPISLNASPTLVIRLYDVCLEIDSNAYKNRGIYNQKGALEVTGTTITLLGNSIYTNGAITLDGNQTKLILDITRPSTNPVFLETWDRISSSDVVELGVLQPDGELFNTINHFPQYGLAIVGNTITDRQGYPVGTDPQNRKTPTVVWNETNKLVGLINTRDSGQVRAWDHSTTSLRYGFYGHHAGMFILAGAFNAPALFHLYNNSFIWTSPYILRTGTLALSTRNIRYDNLGGGATYNRVFFDSNLISERYNFQFIQFEGGFSTFLYDEWGLYPWSFGRAVRTPDVNYTPAVSIFNNGNDKDYTFLSTGVVDLSGSLYGVGSFNMLDGRRNNLTITGNRFLKITSPTGLKRVETEFGFGYIEDPIRGLFRPFQMEIYTPTIR